MTREAVDVKVGDRLMVRWTSNGRKYATTLRVQSIQPSFETVMLRFEPFDGKVHVRHFWKDEMVEVLTANEV